MDYITVKEAGDRWGLSPRRVQQYCSSGSIAGAQRFGRTWVIPAAAKKPEPSKRASVLPFGVSNFIMTRFYNAAGSADSLTDTLQNEEARQLYAAQLAYYRGQTQEAHRIVEGLLTGELCFESRIECALLLALCGMYDGSIYGWNRARAMFDAMQRECTDSAALRITVASLNGVMYIGDAPEWLMHGDFSDFAPISHPVLCYLYAKWLLTQKRYEGLIAAIEPMIAFTRAEGSLLAELYLHMIAAIAYYDTGDGKRSEEQIERALDLALPDRLYGVLAEYRRQLGISLDDAVKRRDPQAAVRVREIYDRLVEGFGALHSAVTGNTFAGELTDRELEAAKLASHGLSNREIAGRMGISVNSVKAYLQSVYNKLQVSSRGQLKSHIL